ncbi:MAG: hypothetical protein HY558_06975 [Euryarchaeota archaeon]|nr:hypothetical protein [Euryarchaeota archaeon]
MKANRFTREDSAIELPINLVVLLVIALAAMAAILAILGGRPAIPPSLTATVTSASSTGGSVEGAVVRVNQYGANSFTLSVSVTDAKGGPVNKATCLTGGLGASASGTTGATGVASLQGSLTLPGGQDDGKLSLLCTASGFKEFDDKSAITVRKV